MAPSYSFADFEFQTSPYRLTRSGSVQSAPPQSLRLLGLLVENAGEVVDRETIRAELWPEEIHVEFDRGITMAVRQLRQVLGDDPRDPRFIETAPRVGYRFVARVEHGPSTRNGRRLGGRQMATFAASALCVAVAVALMSGPESDPNGMATVSRPAIDRPVVADPPQARWRPISGGSAADLRELGARLTERPDPIERNRGLFLLSEAARRDPNEAENLLQVAEAGYAMRWEAPPRAVLRWTEPAARQVLTVAPELARPHLILGDLEFRLHRRWDLAERHFREATRLDPADGAAWHYLGRLELARGNFAVAERALLRAEELGRRGALLADIAYAYLLAGDLAAAHDFAGRAVAQERWNMFDYVVAIEVFTRTAPNRAIDLGGSIMSVYGVAPARRIEDWWSFQVEYDRQADVLGIAHLSEAALHLWRVGSHREAVSLLAEACEERSGWSLPFVDVDPRFAELRGDARYDECRPESQGSVRG